MIANGTATICAGASVDLTSKITGYASLLSPVWTLDNASGTSVSTPKAVKPSSTTTYFLIAQNALGCKDTAKVEVTVNAKPKAGTDQTLACADAATNTLTTTTTLVPVTSGGTFTQIGTTPAVASISGNNVSGMSAAGTYQFQYIVSGCLDTVAVTVSPCSGCVKPNAGADAAAVCQPTSTAKLAAVTTGGTWAAQTGNPAVATINATGTITGLSTAGTYKFIYSVTEGGQTCTDTAQVTVNVKPDAGADQIDNNGICSPATITNLKGTPTGGTWSVLTKPNGATPAVTAAGAVSDMTMDGLYSFVYTFINCTDTVQVERNAKPSAGGDQTICAPTATTILQGLSSAGGVWSVGSKPDGTMPLVNSDGEVTDLDSTGSYEFIYSVGGCTDTVNVVVSNCDTPKGSITGMVFYDNDDNNTKSSADTPVLDAEVVLLDSNGIAIDTIETSASGVYSFTELASGKYSLQFVISNGSEFVEKGIGNTNTNSDANADGTTQELTIDTSKSQGDPARDIKFIDAGIKVRFGSIGDYAWFDTNRDGTQDTNELPASGIQVELLNEEGDIIDSTTTNNNGKYLFTQVISGDYQVRFIAPTTKSYTFSRIGLSPADANTSQGLSAFITIDATQDSANILRNNLTIDAGLIEGCAKPNAGIDQTLECGINTATLQQAGNGQKWKVLKLQPNTTVTVTTPEGIVSGLTVAGQYQFLLQTQSDSLNCRDTVMITVPDCSAQIDLVLKQTISAKRAKLGDTLTYNIKVWNESTKNATGVEVTDQLPADLQYVSNTPSRGTYNSTTGLWTIGNIAAAGDTVRLTIIAKVVAEGVTFNTAEISKVDQKDKDSTPGNGKDGEDDIDRACITVPVKLCLGESILALVPQQYTGVTWYKDGQPIGSGNTYSISQTGSYTFTASNGSCPAGGCCPIVVTVTDCCKPDICEPYILKKIKSAKK